MIDVQLFGMNPGGHHLTNVFIHAASSVILLMLLFRLTGALWQSSFVAAMFALHPLHVESVAWVAERKDVLSAFFCFLTLLMYAEFTAKRKPTLYILALLFFVMGLMSKPMLVTLPVVMLLMDFWPLDRYGQDYQELGLRQLTVKAISLLKEKIPFFACSLLFGILTIYAQNKAGAISDLGMVHMKLRIENSMVAYVKYIGKTLWPSDLAVYYPFPHSIPLWQVVGSLLVLLLLSAATVRAWRRHPYLAVGWFWFLVTLLPVIGLTQSGEQSMADRFSYIPHIGFFIMIAWGVPNLVKDLPYRQYLLSMLAGTVIIASAALTWHQLGYWRDDISLYRHTLKVTNGNLIIHYNLAAAYAKKLNLDAAIYEYREALRISPNDLGVHLNLAHVLSQKGDLDAAIYEYREALRINPNYMEAHNNLGVTLANKGDLDAAILEFKEALRIRPSYMEARTNLGGALARKGDLDAAIRECKEVLRITPNNKDAQIILELALAQKKRM